MAERVGRAILEFEIDGKQFVAGVDQVQAKAQQLGAGLQRVGKQGSEAASGVDILGGSLAKLTAAFSVSALIERAVTGLIDYGREAIGTASRLVDLSAKTGLSTEALQRMEFAGKQSGVALDDLTTASFKLGVKLSEGGAKARTAVTELGLSFNTLKNQKPDEQFNAVVAALEKIEDPTRRNRIGVELFGKSFAAIAPAIVQGYSAMAASAKVSSDAQIKAIDNAADAWDRFVARQKTTVQSWLGNLVIANETIKKLSKEQQAHYQSLLVTGQLEAAQKFLLEVADKLAKQVDIPLPSDKPAPPTFVAFSKQLAAARAEVAKLTVEEKREIVAAQALGKSTDEITDRFGLSEAALRVLNASTKDYEDAQKKAAEAAKKMAEDAAKLQAALDKFTHESILQSIESLKDWGEEGRKQLKAQIADWLADKAAAEKLLKTIYEIENATRIGEVDTKALPGQVDIETVGRLKEKFDDLDDAEKKAAERARQFHQNLNVLAAALSSIGQIAGGSFGAIASGLGRVISIAASATSALEMGFGFALTVYELGTAIDEADAAAKRLDAHRRIVQNLGNDFRNARMFSDGLAQSIEDITKQLRTLENQRGRTQTAPATGTAVPRPPVAAGTDQALAEALKINDIIKELGGLSNLTAAQLQMVQTRVADLFTLIARGGPLAVQATEALDTVLTDMGANATKSGGLVSKFFLDMLAKARAAGVELEKVNAFLLEQTKTNTIGGLSAFVAGDKDAAAKLEDVKKQLAAIKDERDDLMRRGQLGVSDSKRLADLNKQWEDLTEQARKAQAVIAGGAVTSQEAATALGSAAAGAWAEMVRQGVPLQDIVAQLGPTIEALAKKFEAAGFDGGAAFNELRDEAALAKDEIAGPLISGIQGLGMVLAGIHNTGKDSQETFSGLTQQIAAMYGSLVKEGKGGAAALRLIQDPLQKIWQLHKDENFAIDDATQALLDQAEEAGIVGDKMRPIQEQQLIATNRIADAVEKLAAVFGILPDAAEAAADGISDGLSKIKAPKVKIDVDWDVPDIELPDGTIVHIPKKPAAPKPLGVPGFATGTKGLVNFGPGTLAMLHGREAVIPEAGFDALFRKIGDRQPIIFEEHVTIDVGGIHAIDKRGLDEHVEQEVLPRIVNEIEDHRRGYAQRLKVALGTT